MLFEGKLEKDDIIKYLQTLQMNNMNFSKAQKLSMSAFFKNCRKQSSDVKKLRCVLRFLSFSVKLFCAAVLLSALIKMFSFLQKNREAVAAMLEQSKEEFTELIQSKDLNLLELSRVKNQQAEKLEQIQTTIQELQNSLALEIQRYNELLNIHSIFLTKGKSSSYCNVHVVSFSRAKELEDKLMANKKELELRNTLLGKPP